MINVGSVCSNIFMCDYKMLKPFTQIGLKERNDTLSNGDVYSMRSNQVFFKKYTRPGTKKN